MTGRLRIVTTEALEELVTAGHLTPSEFEVTVSEPVHCADCDTRVSATDLIERVAVSAEPNSRTDVTPIFRRGMTAVRMSRHLPGITTTRLLDVIVERWL